MDRMDSDSQLSLSEIESGLERLMPRGLGDESRVEFEGVIDDLANSASVIPFWKKATHWQAAAAAILVVGLTGAYLILQNGTQADRTLAHLGAASPVKGIEILEQKTWIDSGTDLGVQALSQSGDVSQGWSYTGVEEERVLHGSTGYEVILQREFEAELYAVSSL